jgi:predicted enzyme related to lactoylglutathione lyase
MITNVKLVGVCVRDQQKALDFYTQKLGFTLVADIPMGDSLRWIEVSPPGAETHLALFTPQGLEDRIGSFANIVFTCEDVQATFEALRERGVIFKQDLKVESWGTSAMFIDQDGNQFVLSSKT